MCIPTIFAFTIFNVSAWTLISAVLSTVALIIIIDTFFILWKRYKEKGIYSNSELTSKLIADCCKLDKKSEELLKNAFKKLKLSVRAYEKILKVARTIADLDEKKDIEFKHIAEAIQYRSLDKFIK